MHRHSSWLILVAGFCAGTALARPQGREAQAAGASKKSHVIAIPDAKKPADPKAAEAVKEIIGALRFDFELVQDFELLDPTTYKVDARREGMAKASIKFPAWKEAGAELLIKVKAELKGRAVSAEMRLYDVEAKKELLKKDGEADPFEVRHLAHAFADEVYQKLTGERGIFATRIAAARRVRNTQEIWLMDIDGKNLRPVTNNHSRNLLPSWSQDGRTILFTSYVGRNASMYAVLLQVGRPRLISGFSGLNTGGATSPDGSRIALTLSKDGDSEIYTMNPDSTDLRRLTEVKALDLSPSWSPDGKELAFVSSRSGDPHIYVMNADGSNVRRITTQGNYNQTPDWSPRGDMIVYTGRDAKGAFDVYTLNLKTKETKRLTQNQGDNEEPSFSPDGRYIVFSSTRNGTPQLFIAPIDGSKQTPITEGAFYTPAWSPFLDGPSKGSKASSPP